MGRPQRLVAIVVVLLGTALTAAAAVNLNTSRSNAYRLTYHATLLGAAQAKAMLAELDKVGPMGEEAAKVWLKANFRRFGIDPQAVKKMVVLPAGKVAKETAILLLANPADETAAMAVTVKGSKSNTSE